jgi:hypothetical protein
VQAPARCENGRHKPNGGWAAVLLGNDLTLRRETVVTVLTLLVLFIALPFAIIDTIETGRVYLFSRQFLEELPQRFTGPGRFRFILQPTIASVLGIRSGLDDAKAGNPPYLFGLFFGDGPRRDLLRSGVAAIRTLVAMGIIMDLVFQLILYHSVHPGPALVVGPIFICFPYALSRALTTRMTGMGRVSPPLGKSLAIESKPPSANILFRYYGQSHQVADLKSGGVSLDHYRLLLLAQGEGRLQLPNDSAPLPVTHVRSPFLAGMP